MGLTYWPDGTVKESFNAADGIYSRHDEAGALVEERPFIDVEWADYRATVAHQIDLTDKVAAQVPDLLVMIDDLNARLDIPKADLSNRELRRTIRDVKQLARVVTQLVRLVGNALDSTDSGTP